MRKKTPKSHTYTILSLSIIILAVSGAVVSGQLTEKEDVNEIHSVSAPTSSILEVREASESGQITSSDQSEVLHSQSAGLQSAGGVEIYDTFSHQDQGNASDNVSPQ